MRTLLAGELDQAQSFDSDHYVKLEVQNGSGTWIDVGAALGSRWIIDARVGGERRLTRLLSHVHPRAADRGGIAVAADGGEPSQRR
jgi:hypothetical protein